MPTQKAGKTLGGCLGTGPRGWSLAFSPFFLHLPKKVKATSSIVIGGTRPFYNNMAPFALLNEEVPTMRLPNIKMLLHWPSRMHIYGSIGPFQWGGGGGGYEIIFQYYGSVGPL